MQKHEALANSENIINLTTHALQMAQMTTDMDVLGRC